MKLIEDAGYDITSFYIDEYRDKNNIIAAEIDITVYQNYEENIDENPYRVR